MVSSVNRKGRRIAALWFAHLPTDRVQRVRQVLPDQVARLPLVVTVKSDNALRLGAVDAHAKALGLASGMTLADARAMVPALDVVVADEGEDHRLLTGIAGWCERYTPLVALDAPHGLLLDITGAAHLFGGEEAMLQDMRIRLEDQGFTLRGAIAGNAAAARALARGKDGAIVRPGEDAAAIAPLPLEVLDLDPLVQHALRRAGLKTVGLVAARQRSELAVRFGEGFVAALDHVLGRSERPISPLQPLPLYRSEYRFGEPISTQEQVYTALQGLAVRLGDAMERYGEGVRCLEAQFFRSDGAVRRISIETAQPTRDSGSMTRLLRERLDALADPLDHGFGYDLIRLCARRSERMVPQSIGFDSQTAAQEEVTALIDRLGARFGTERIMVFQPADTHLPEGTATCVPVHRISPAAMDWQGIRRMGEAPRRPLRMFARPEPVEVTAQIPEGPPLQFLWRRAMHLVARAEGPERIAMAWWHDEAPQTTRDYYRVEDRDGRRFWLYRDGVYGEEAQAPRWFMHGMFA